MLKIDKRERVGNKDTRQTLGGSFWMQFELGLKINECVSNCTPGITTDSSFEVLTQMSHKKQLGCHKLCFYQ